MPLVFVSHSTHDREFVEKEIIPLLEGQGIEAWYSKDNIVPADQWERTILKGLKTCDAFLLVMSPNSAQSPWVKREVDWMFHKGSKTIIPVLLQECEADDFHIGMVSLQHVDFSKEWELGRKKLLQTLKYLTAKEKNAHPPKSGEIITNSLGMKFAWIPSGGFMMGSPREEEERQDNETQHKVTLSKGFYMGVHLVTQEQWQAMMGNNPSNFRGEKNLPVEQVSWNDCQEFIKKLREKDKKAYRLPSEAEWEYACRAGTRTPFHFGETISTDQANYNGSYTYGNGKKGVYREKTTPVDSLPANAWGLHDMHGNVWEWCQDWLGDYLQEDVVDPQGPDAGQYRLLRGGSWFDHPRIRRSASRYRGGPGNSYDDCGFRLCFCLD